VLGHQAWCSSTAQFFLWQPSSVYPCARRVASAVHALQPRAPNGSFLPPSADVSAPPSAPALLVPGKSRHYIHYTAIQLAVVVWLSGNIIGRINEVILCRAGLVLRWVTVRGYTVLVSSQATQAHSAWPSLRG